MTFEVVFPLILVVMIWFILGFIAFLLEAKRTRNYIEFNKSAKEDFILFIGFGLFTFIVEIVLIFKNKFEDYMDKLLRDICSK